MDIFSLLEDLDEETVTSLDWITAEAHGRTGDIGVAMEKVENQVEPVIIVLAREEGCLDWGNSRIIIL